MSDHYKFFSHKQCEYYPCHQLDEINCLFCYCPLYILKDCKGNYRIFLSIKNLDASEKIVYKNSYQNTMIYLRNLV